MSSVCQVTIHSSQFPENVRRDLFASLRTRRINHKFHYDSVKQTQKWLALHQRYSPSRKDADCRRIYEEAFKTVSTQVLSRNVHVIGLGCGGGQKDTRLLQLLRARGRDVFYTPCDVSTAMVLTARQTALSVLAEKNCCPVVCDLAAAADLRGFLVTRHRSLVTFFGMIPNFEPEGILPKLAALVGPKEFLLFSANLAPGGDDAWGIRKILPQYDNELTRDWLMTFLLDLGITRRHGALRFEIENGGFGLKRVAAHFHLRRTCPIQIEDQTFAFRRGDRIRLFFSYRYTPERVHKILAQYKMRINSQWIMNSEEEGVFLCSKA